MKRACEHADTIETLKIAMELGGEINVSTIEQIMYDQDSDMLVSGCRPRTFIG